MLTSRRRRLPLGVLGSILVLQALSTGCAREEDRRAPMGVSPQVVVPALASLGPTIRKAGVNAPSGGSFTCWIAGSGFEDGDRVLVNGTTEIPTTFGNPGLVTFVAGVALLDGRTALTLVVLRPGTELRSNPFDAPIPPASPQG